MVAEDILEAQALSRELSSATVSPENMAGLQDMLATAVGDEPETIPADVGEDQYQPKKADDMWTDESEIVIDDSKREIIEHNHGLVESNKAQRLGLAMCIAAEEGELAQVAEAVEAGAQPDYLVPGKGGRTAVYVRPPPSFSQCISFAVKQKNKGKCSKDCRGSSCKEWCRPLYECHVNLFYRIQVTYSNSYGDNNLTCHSCCRWPRGRDTQTWSRT